MKIHELKIKQQYWHALEAEEKKVEIRKNDRDFQKGDILRIQPINDKDKFIQNSKGTFKCFNCLVTHVLYFAPVMHAGFVALSIEKLKKPLKSYK